MSRPPLAIPLALATVFALSPPSTRAADDPVLNRAFQDHIAYVATFAMPVLIEKCSAADPAYLQRAAPLYFRYVNAHQDRIERGRQLTLAELKPDDTLKAYRERVLAQRLGKLDTGTPEERTAMCQGALVVLEGTTLPGEWPSRG
ncbi:MAG: hypothetical protein KF800_04905 [Lysobacter sp.]|nr:hypothetical protein [Lysobacter sp.]